jgi:hypothetical protein
VFSLACTEATGLQRSPIISDNGGGGGGGGGAGQQTDRGPAADSTLATPLLPALPRRGQHASHPPPPRPAPPQHTSAWAAMMMRATPSAP